MKLPTLILCSLICILLPLKVMSQSWVQVGSNLYGETHSGFFSENVVINYEGNVIATTAKYDSVGGIPLGQTRVYWWDQGDWHQKGNGIVGEAVGDHAGESLAIDSTGNTLAIGASFNDGNGQTSGHVRVYSWNGTAWMQKGADIDGEAAGDQSGESVSLNADGNIVAIGALFNDGNGMHSGHVRVYEWNGSSWTQKGQDIDGESAGDASGTSVALSPNANFIAIGAIYNAGTGPSAGHARVYEWQDTIWVQKGQDLDGEAASDRHGSRIAIGEDGNSVAISSAYNAGNGVESGHVRVYSWNGAAWVQKGADLDGEAAGDQSGHGMSLSHNGNTIAIGAPYNEGTSPSSGHVRVFNWDGAAWNQLGSDIDGEDGNYFGSAVKMNKDASRLLVGSPGAWHNGRNGGMIQVFTLSGASVEDISAPFEVALFPNPVSEELNIALNNPVDHLQVRIADMAGRVVHKSDHLHTRDIRLSLNVEHGIYNVGLSAEGFNLYRKVLVEY